MKKKRTWKKLSMLLLMAILILTMSLSAEAAAKISKSKATLYPGSSVTLKVSGTKTKVKWSSSNKKVAKVSSKGKVTAVKQGSTVIKAKVGKKTYRCKVTVKAPALSQKKLTLAVNTSKTLKLNGTKIKSVSTSNKKIATVTKKGKITAKKPGKCTITFKGANKKKYKCQVTVTVPKAKPTAKPTVKPTATPAPTATPVPVQLKSDLNNKINSLSNNLERLVDNSFKTDTQKLLDQARSIYTNSKDESTISDMIAKLDERSSVISPLRDGISVFYQGHSYRAYSSENSIYISGSEDTLGNIEVTPNAEDSESLIVDVQDVTGQDYVKLITLSDTQTGAAICWKVYYTFDVSLAFEIQDVSGDGVSDYSIYKAAEKNNPVIVVYKDKNTGSSLTLSVKEGVTYTIEASSDSDYDEVVNMKYGDYTYKYFLSYKYKSDSHYLYISKISGNDILRNSINYNTNTIRLYGFSDAMPVLNVNTVYSEATAELINNSTVLRVSYKDLFCDYTVSYIKIDPVELKLNAEAAITIPSDGYSFAAFTPETSGTYRLSDSYLNNGIFTVVYDNDSYYASCGIPDNIDLEAGKTYYFALFLGNGDPCNASICLTKVSDSSENALADAGLEAEDSDELFEDGTSDSTIESAETGDIEDSNITDEDIDVAVAEDSAEASEEDTTAVSEESPEVSVEDFSE